MATNGTNFVQQTATTLNGTAVTTAPYVDMFGPKEAMAVSQPTQPKGGSGSPIASSAVVIDRVTFDPSLTSTPLIGTPPAVPECYGTYIGNCAKNGAALLSLTGTTPITVDLTNLVAATGVTVAGDSTFATANALILNNLGAVDLVVSPGASNPARIPELGGTSPTITVPAGSVVACHSAAGLAVDSTHKTITVTPTSGGTLGVTVCGA